MCEYIFTYVILLLELSCPLVKKGKGISEKRNYLTEASWLEWGELRIKLIFI